MSILATEKLASCEKRIERNLQGFYEVGKALAEIRDEGLYEADYGTFENYVKNRWGWNRDRAYKLIAAAEVAENVSDRIQPPANEWQTRELGRLPKESQAEAWREAVQTSPHGKPTAAHVREVVNKRTGEVIDPEDVEVVKSHKVASSQKVSGGTLVYLTLDPKSPRMAASVIYQKFHSDFVSELVSHLSGFLGK